MPTLAERRAQVAANGGQSNADFIKFKVEGETKYLRFLFTDATTIESHKKYWDNEAKKMYVDDQCPEGKGSYKIVFDCVEYDVGGANARRVRWEVSEYLYNEYLSPYIEKDTPASKNVWEIKVRRPGTMDVSYIAFPVNGATEANYPIPALETQSTPNSQTQAPAAPNYTQQPQQQQSAPAATNTAAETQVPLAQQQAPAAPKKSKYF